MDIKKRIEESIAVKTRLLEDVSLIEKIKDIVDICVEAFKNGNKLLLCGNGGSAADAQHIAAELSGRFYKDRPALFAEALSVNNSFVTAVANDYGYDHIYARAIESKGVKGDVLISISTSGNSSNILNAMNKAKEIGIVNISWTGESGGKMKEICDVLINIPSSDTPRIQEAHILVGHIICEMIENEMFEK